MEGHDEAFTKAGVLHKDISVGNIMIVRKEDGTSEGLLIDWDLCCLVGPTDGPRRATRTGTWQFISCQLLQKPGAPHTIMDDRESALHLLTWLVLRHVKHNLSPQATEGCLKVFDQLHVKHAGAETGGSQKQINLTMGYQVPSELVFEHVPHLKSLINGLAAVFAFRYRKAPSEGEYKALEKLQDFLKDQPEFLANHPGFLANHPTQVYTTKMNLLKESGWLVKFLRDHIEHHEWPLHDGALLLHASEPVPAIRSLENTTQ
ncbi:hypothetical protein FIBSPDRAFT_185054 [Athelia psychrophila]|uniref:Fungal-type protein kinase domain-containing protein n=1 Tax=Athelia psychrophila TaxID=1759441 RepID=A0A166ADC3_9AGAM|nr:hypothetical protein FIBSPDRAFT_185054 [Fibularhizoctonia sp. CBS 109695]